MSLQWFRQGVIASWRKWLARRRRRGYLSWALFSRLLKRYPLPPAVVVHSVYRA
jgi:RNA-directed DNA polymerase